MTIKKPTLITFIHQQTMVLLLIITLMGCQQGGLVEEDSLAQKEYTRIISTSVAGDTLLIDLLLPEEVQRLVGLSRAFNDYGLDGALELLESYSIPKDFDLTAMESLFFYQPDLVIASRWALQNEHEELFNRLKVDLHILEVPVALDQVYTQIEVLAARLGGVASTHAQELTAKLFEVEALLARRAELLNLDPLGLGELRVLDVNSSGNAAGSNTTLNLIIELAGLQNLGKTLAEASAVGYAPLSEEMILLLDPEIIIADSQMAERLRSEAVFSQLRAVEQGFIFEIDQKRQRLFYSATHHLMFASVQFQEQVLEWLNYL